MSDPSTLLAIVIGAVAAAVLFALQHLHVRPLQQRVATLLFWRQAAQQQRRRVIWGKFSHPWVYALLTLIALLLAASLFIERWSRGTSQQPAVLVVDIGYSMSASDAKGRRRIDDAIEQATADLARRGSEGAALVSAGPQPRLLVAAEAPAALTRLRLARLQAADLPADSTGALEMATSLLPENGGQVIWYTDQVAFPPEVAPEVARRVSLRHVGADQPNACIATVIFEPAGDDPTRGTLRVRVEASGGYAGPITLTATRAAGSAGVPARPMPAAGSAGVPARPMPAAEDSRAPTAPTAAVKTVQGRVSKESDLILDNLAADGSTFSLSISGAPGPTADDHVSFRLPRRVPLRFRFIGDIPRPLRTALLAIGTEASASEPAILVGSASASASAVDQAQIRIADGGPAGNSGAALQLQPGMIAIDDLDLEGALAGDGAAVAGASEDARPVVRAGPAVMAALDTVAAVPTLDLSPALWSGDLPRRAAFPVLLQRLCRVLAGWSDAPAAVPAGRTLADPLWPQQGAASSEFRRAVVFDRLAGGAVVPARPIPAAADSRAPTSGLRLFELALVAAMALLTVEGLLYAARKIV